MTRNASLRSVGNRNLCQRENVQRDSLGGPRFMDEPANPFGSLTREGRLAATLTDLGGNMFDEDGTTINREHLAHKFVSRGCVAAYLAVKHG